MRTALFLIFVVSCTGRGIEYEGGDTAVVETVECGADLDMSVGFRISGQAIDLETGAPAAEGLCIEAIDPAPALTGGDPTTIAASQICADGEYVVANIEEIPSVGMFLVINDCEDSNSVMRTATGIASDEYASLGDGDALEDVRALVVSTEHQDTIDADLQAAGYEGLASEVGYLAGFIVDNTGDPVSGATLGCSDCAPIYYRDADPSDGLFSSGGSPNLESAATAEAGFLIPGAPVFNYTCEDGGTHVWEASLQGSLPEYGVYIRFVAD